MNTPIDMFNVNMADDVATAVAATLHSGYVAEGPKVKEFEDALWPMIGNAIAVNSGTSALTLALIASDVQPGSIVISTPMTCTATNLPILSLGGKIVWSDVSPYTGNVTLAKIKEAYNSLTEVSKRKLAAIMVTDWGGLPPQDMAEIAAFAHRHGAKLIEDAAHAFSTQSGEADFTCFSFQAIKHLTTGDGGAIVTAPWLDLEVHERIKKLRWFGIDRTAGFKDSRIDQDIYEVGYKFHMNDIAATIGLSNLANIGNVLHRHETVAEYYNEGLSPYFYRTFDATESACWLYTVRLPNKDRRDAFIRYMKSEGVTVSQVHKRNDDYAVFGGRQNNLTGLNDFADRMVCLPCHAALTPGQVDRVITLANNFAEFIR